MESLIDIRLDRKGKKKERVKWERRQKVRGVGTGSV